MIKDIVNKKSVRFINYALYLLGGATIALALYSALSNTRQYPHNTYSYAQNIILYPLAFFALLVIPGLVIIKSTLLKNLIPRAIHFISTIPVSILMWIILSLSLYNLLGVFNFLVYVLGFFLCLLCLLVFYLKNKKLPQLIEIEDLKLKNVLFYIVLIIPVLFSARMFIGAYKNLPYLTNYDSQTHSLIITNIFERKILDIKYLFANNLGSFHNQWFYPFGFHIVISLLGWIIGENSIELPQNIVIIFGSLLPIFFSSFIYLISGNRKMSVLSAFFSVLLQMFPFGILQWGGISQFFGEIMMLWITGISILLINKYKFSDLKVNIIWGLLFLPTLIIHPSVSFTIIVYLSFFIIHAIRKLKKPQLKTLLLSGLIISGIGLLVYFSFTQELLIVLRRIVLSNKSKVKTTEVIFDVLMFVRIPVLNLIEWFMYDSLIWGVVMGLGCIYILFSLKRSLGEKGTAFSRNIAYIFFGLLSMLLVSSIAGATTNVPILEQIANMYIHNYRRASFFLYLPIITLLTYSVYKFFVYPVIIKKDYIQGKGIESYLVKFVITLLLLGGLLNQSYSRVSEKFDKDIRQYSLPAEEFESMLYMRDNADAGTIVSLPYAHMRNENNLNWVNSLNLDTPTLITRGFKGLDADEYQKRLDILKEIHKDPSYLCSLDTDEKTQEYDISYVYLSAYQYYPNDKRNITLDMEKIFESFYEKVDALDCTEVFYESDKVAVFAID